MAEEKMKEQYEHLCMCVSGVWDSIFSLDKEQFVIINYEGLKDLFISFFH